MVLSLVCIKKGILSTVVSKRFCIGTVGLSLNRTESLIILRSPATQSLCFLVTKEKTQLSSFPHPVRACRVSIAWTVRSQTIRVSSGVPECSNQTSSRRFEQSVACSIGCISRAGVGTSSEGSVEEI